MSSAGKSLREFGKFRLDTEKRVLWHEDEPVALPLKGIELLCVLTESGGEVVTKDELLERVWQNAFVEESNLSRHIYLLRKTFKRYGEEEEVIQTIPRRGYRFAGEVREAEDAEIIIERHALTQTLIEVQDNAPDEPSGARQVAPEGVNQRWARWRGTPRRRRAAVLAVTFILLAGVAGLAFWRNHGSQADAATPPIHSIAVLPFKTIDAADSSDHRGLGMADILITRLSNVKALKVRPTSAILAYENGEQDSVAAGRSLRVDAILEGTIYRSNNHERVTVRLLRVGDQSSVWAGQFEKQTQDEMRLQDEIALQVVDALVLSLDSDERKALIKPYTKSADAYQFYQQGRYQWNKRSTAAMIEAERLFRNAIAADPSFALAYVGLADTLAMRANEEARDEVRLSVDKALELDPQLAEAHASLGFYKMFHEWQWAEAEGAFKKALELNPGYATAHHWYATLLEIEGRNDEARAELQRALEINPVSYNFLADLGQAYYFARDYEKAKAYCREALDIYPDFHFAHGYLADIYLLTGEYDTSVDERLKADASAFALVNAPANLQMSREGYLSLHRQTFQQGGIKRFLATRFLASHADSRTAYMGAKVCAFLGEKEKALDLLEMAYRGRAFLLAFAKADPIFDGLRAEPRYQAILSRMGLAPQ